MNEPLTWPKSSDSRSPSGIEPQAARPDRLARYTAAVETAPDPADTGRAKRVPRKKAEVETETEPVAEGAPEEEKTED